VKPVTIDFETFGIEARPEYPPRPVGVAIQWPGRKPTYHAWGHPTGNNCTLEQARAELYAAWQHPGGVLFHNAKFDVDVAETHLGMTRLPWERIHDTMFLLFLHDPHAPTFALKPSSESLLGMAPEEQEEVREWLVERKIVSKASKGWGAFIAYAPGDLVGRYAAGDVIRTTKLFNLLHPSILKRKMGGAYDRERELMLILLDNERRGLRVATGTLENHVRVYSDVMTKVDGWLYRKLKNKLNLDSGPELVEALLAAKMLDEAKLGLTPTGAKRTDKESLKLAITDRTVAAMLNYRASLSTCLRTFMQPWLATAQSSGGRIFTSWNQVRSSSEYKQRGAVTGRLSSSPNFQNIPNEFPPVWSHEKKGLPRPPFPLPALPRCRSYIICDAGCVLVGRDYSQQELRVLAHYAGGPLLEAYQGNPRLDVHAHALKLLQDEYGLLRDLPEKEARKRVKTVGFGLIYGMGLRLLSIRMGVSYDEAKQIKNAYLSIFPGLRELSDTMRERAEAKQPIRTWGGREYFCEPPQMVDGETRTFEYKLINVLVQGSSACCTKQAVINLSKLLPQGCSLLLTVHDEILIQAPRQLWQEANTALESAMLDVDFLVPMLSDGKMSRTSWAEMEAISD
jgi:DNA polymerase-1